MDIEKKYELIPSDMEGLYRIKALKDFNDVKNGDIGGYVESEKNLSQYDDCWIYDNAIVHDNAVVIGNALIFNNAVIYGNAIVSDHAQIYDNAVVRDNAKVCDYAELYDNAVVMGKAIVCDYTELYDNAQIWGDAIVQGNAIIGGDAMISSDKDYIIFKNWWSSGRYFTWTRSNNMWKVGCFYGTGEELIVKAYKDSEESGREYKKIVKYVESII